LRRHRNNAPYYVSDWLNTEPYFSGGLELGKAVQVGQYRMYVHEHRPEIAAYLLVPDQLNYRIWSKLSKLVYVWQGIKLRLHLTAYVWGLAKRPGSYF